MKITHLNHQSIIESISTAFMSNRRMNLISEKRGEGLKKDIKKIISFAYNAVAKCDGIIYSKEKKSFLLFYQKSSFHLSFKDKLRYLKIAWYVVGISRLKKAIRRERLVREVRRNGMRRFADKDFLYVWFMAQDKSEKDLNGLMEIKRKILQLAENMKLPIYIETTDQRLLKIYNRMGFQFYDQLEQKQDNFKIWFGRLQPSVK